MEGIMIMKQKKNLPQKLIQNLEYGAVLSEKIWGNYLLVYYESNTLFFFNLEIKKITKMIQLEENIEKKELFIGNYITILKRNDHIRLCYREEKFYMALHALCLKAGNEKQKKIIGEGWILETGYDNYFRIYRDIDIFCFSGKHNNWVSDACMTNNKIYTVSYDGYIKEWEADTGRCVGYYALKDGWITAICSKDERLFVGTQYGAVYLVSKEDMCCQEGDMGSIWNIYQFNDRIYTVSEDGKVALFDEKFKKLKTITCSDGWVNALVVYHDGILAVTSYGEMLFMDKELNEWKLMWKVEKWINNIVIIGEYAYLATAEGYILRVDIKTKTFTQYKISTYQLIDILLIDEKIVVADVEGNIYFIGQNFREERKILLSRMHITSMCYNTEENMLFVGTLDNAVIMIPLNNKDEYKILEIGKSRIWKIDYEKESGILALTTTMKQVVVFKNNIIKRIKTDNFITSCKIIGNNIVCGNNKGEIEKYSIKRNGREEKVNMRKNEKRDSNIFIDANNKIFVVCDKSATGSHLYEKRDIKILELCGYKYEELDIGNNEILREEIVKRSGWLKFPQILFYGHFISSASVLPHMYATGTLCRCVENIMRDQNIKISKNFQGKNLLDT